ncbi:MAG: hypothetical protein RIM80_23770, partial [Alphaproteobacteria bacterium]
MPIEFPRKSTPSSRRRQIFAAAGLASNGTLNHKIIARSNSKIANASDICNVSRSRYARNAPPPEADGPGRRATGRAGGLA